MTFACLGLFRSLLTRENRTIRYLSDSAYWLYLAHLPLILGAQMVIQNWPGPAVLKCLLLTLVITAFHLFVYVLNDNLNLARIASKKFVTVW